MNQYIAIMRLWSTLLEHIEASSRTDFGALSSVLACHKGLRSLMCSKLVVACHQ